ncbi:MAG: PIG-L family deacetylase [Pseudoxanthomonas sp.]
MQTKPQRSCRASAMALLLATAPCMSAAQSQATSDTLTLPSPPDAGAARAPDQRYAVDILLVVAHPDDEMFVAPWLAKARLEQRQRIAVLYMTRGDAGGNVLGAEQGQSLALVREIEARRALALLGIDLVWFLDAPDTPAVDGHDVRRSLAAWDHGKRLGQLVRVIRLTKPKVVVSMLPDVVVGENHGDHQAAGVIATEAFDVAGDPAQFSEQLASSPDPTRFGQLLEGLHPWQPQKLYFFSDADAQDFLQRRGPRYAVTDKSPAGRAYFRYWLGFAHTHQTQYLNLPPEDMPVPADGLPSRAFVLGKTLVGGRVTDDVLHGVREVLIDHSPPQVVSAKQDAPVISLGGPWAFYRSFWSAHGLAHLAKLQATPVLGVTRGSRNVVPILLRNDSANEILLSIEAKVPSPWTVEQPFARYPVPANSVREVSISILAPERPEKTPALVELKLRAGDRILGDTSLAVHVR